MILKSKSTITSPVKRGIDMELDMTYRLCAKLAKTEPPWYVNRRAQERLAPWRKQNAEGVADRIFTATVRADRGANWQAAQADVMATAQFFSLLRSDFTPAAAIEYMSR